MNAHQFDTVEQIADARLGLGRGRYGSKASRVEAPQHRQGQGIDEHEGRNDDDPGQRGKIDGSPRDYRHAHRAPSESIKGAATATPIGGTATTKGRVIGEPAPNRGASTSNSPTANRMSAGRPARPIRTATSTSSGSQK